MPGSVKVVRRNVTIGGIAKMFKSRYEKKGVMSFEIWLPKITYSATSVPRTKRITTHVQ